MASNRTCSGGTFHVNSKLQGGRNAGRFDFKGRVPTVLECVKRCCDENDCDLAYVDAAGLCYAVHCSNKDLCNPVPGIGKESASVFYVSRQKTSPEGKCEVAQLISLGLSHNIPNSEHIALWSSFMPYIELDPHATLFFYSYVVVKFTITGFTVFPCASTILIEGEIGTKSAKILFRWFAWCIEY